MASDEDARRQLNEEKIAQANRNREANEASRARILAETQRKLAEQQQKRDEGNGKKK